MSLFLIIALAIASFFTALISGVTGMAGGITLLAFMSFLIPFETIVPLHGIVQLTSNGTRTFFLRKNIHKTIFTYFIIGAPLGTFISYQLLKTTPNKNIFYIPIVLLIFYTVFKPKKLPQIKLPFWGYLPLGILTGFMAPLIGATGPLQAPFFLRDDLTKENIVGTKAAAQMFTHLLKIPLFLALDFPYEHYAIILVVMALSTVVGTKVGVSLLGKVSESFFKNLYRFALLIAGLRLLSKIFLV